VRETGFQGFVHGFCAGNIVCGDAFHRVVERLGGVAGVAAGFFMSGKSFQKNSFLQKTCLHLPILLIITKNEEFSFNTYSRSSQW
jgi:hypothetical protein